uniref:Glycosyltransferase family 92 protein n=1 Tax=Poecilia formosa TaxID=48698 RepID=A0A096LWK5_POEFO
ENTDYFLILPHVNKIFLEIKKYGSLVRVIAIVFRGEKVDLSCHLLCLRQMHVSMATVSLHSDHFGFPYSTADIMCSVPPGCGAPNYVTITSTAIDNDLKVDLEFLEVKNQKAKSHSFLYNVTSCFSTMYNFTNVLQLVQSLEMLQLLGVNKVAVYKTNCSADVQRVLDYYTRKGLVVVVPWSLSKYLNVSRRAKPDQDPGDIHYFGQIPALNDCLYRSMYRSKYVALHDPDELILPQTVGSWLKLLEQLERKFGAERCYMFQNNWVPSEFFLTPPAPKTLPQQDQWQNVSGINILAHLYSEPIKPPFGYRNFKTIVNPRGMFAVTVHGVLRAKRVCVWVDRKLARMYHIKSRGPTELKPKQMIYDGRLLNYSARLSSAVNTVLGETGLLPGNSL